MDEAALHEMLSGRRRGMRATLLRSGLHAASWAYSSVMSLRNLAYDRRWLQIHRVCVPVISIGNITTGGTGKTPFAAWLTQWLAAAHRKPGLLSRGYSALGKNRQTPDGQTSERATGTPARNRSPGTDRNLSNAFENDEKLVLDRLCPGVPHLQQKDRVDSARRMIRDFGCDVLVLDDGFQHRRLHRDFDLVLIDALQPWGYGHILPRGLLRERRSGLRRADLVVITRANQCSPEALAAIRRQLKQVRGTDECVEVAFNPTRLVDHNWQPHSLDAISGKTGFAFCGIGNPTGFLQTVGTLGLLCQQTQLFPDHHHYDEAELSNLAESARAHAADVVLTTQKDLVKIASESWHGAPLFAVEIGVTFVSGAELLESRLRQLIGSETKPKTAIPVRLSNGTGGSAAPPT